MAQGTLKAQGKVETVFVKALPEKDKYENTHRASIKLDNGEWYGLGSIKSDVLTVENDEGKWVPLGEGSEVILKYTKNGDYNNSNRSNMMILNLVVGDRSRTNSQAKQPATTTGSTGGGGVDWARKDAGAAASASIDKALAYIALRSGEMKTDYTSVLSVARDMQSMVQQLAGEILTGTRDEGKEEVSASMMAKVPVPTKTKARAAAKPDAEETEWTDEEVPF